jgi:hypothetical protein
MAEQMGRPSARADDPHTPYDAVDEHGDCAVGREGVEWGAAPHKHSIARRLRPSVLEIRNNRTTHLFAKRQSRLPAILSADVYPPVLPIDIL